jgi:hypothetical protein
MTVLGIKQILYVRQRSKIVTFNISRSGSETDSFNMDDIPAFFLSKNQFKSRHTLHDASHLEATISGAVS